MICSFAEDDSQRRCTRFEECFLFDFDVARSEIIIKFSFETHHIVDKWCCCSRCRLRRRGEKVIEVVPSMAEHVKWWCYSGTKKSLPNEGSRTPSKTPSKPSYNHRSDFIAAIIFRYSFASFNHLSNSSSNFIYWNFLPFFQDDSFQLRHIYLAGHGAKIWWGVSLVMTFFYRCAPVTLTPASRIR